MLKSLLQLLLSKFIKKADTEFVSSQAMPKTWGDRIVIQKGVGHFEGSYLAPSTGYLCIDGGNAIQFLELGSGPRSRQQVSNPNTRVNLAWPQIYMPVRKGSSCHYQITPYSDSTDDTTVYFIPSAGSEAS